MLRLDLRVSRMGFLVFLLGGIGEGCQTDPQTPLAGPQTPLAGPQTPLAGP